MAYNTINLESDIKQRVFKIWSLQFAGTIPRFTIDQMQVERFVDHMSQEVLVRFQFFLASEDKIETTTVSASPDIILGEPILVPKTIWDMVKHRYAPEWFKRKFPVNYNEIIPWTKITNITNTTNKITTVHPEIPIPVDPKKFDYFTVAEYGPVNFKENL